MYSSHKCWRVCDLSESVLGNRTGTVNQKRCSLHLVHPEWYCLNSIHSSTHSPVLINRLFPARGFSGFRRQQRLWQARSPPSWKPHANEKNITKQTSRWIYTMSCKGNCLQRRNVYELMEGDGGSISDGVALPKMRHLRKDLNEMRGEPLLSEDEWWVTILPKGRTNSEGMDFRLGQSLWPLSGGGVYWCRARGGSPQHPLVCTTPGSWICVWSLPSVLSGWR